MLSLAKRGVSSIFTYHSNQSEAKKVVSLVAETGRKAIAWPLDAGNISAFDSFLQQVRDALADLGAEHFDYLVNNAGGNKNRIGKPGMAFEQSQRLLRLNSG